MTPSSHSARDYRAALIEQLRLVAEALSESSDPTLVLDGLSAAGLLDEDLAQGAEEALRSVKALSPERVAAAMALVDQTRSFYDLDQAADEHDREERLERLVMAAGLVASAPSQGAELAERLREAAVWVQTEPDVSDLQPAASVIQAALVFDLRPEHPAASFVNLLADGWATEEDPLTPEQRRRALERARLKVFPPPVLVWARGVGSPSIARQVEEHLVQQPQMAASTGAEEESVPLVLPLTVPSAVDGEASLLVGPGDRLRIGWVGQGDPPHSVRWEGQALQTAERLADEVHTWALPSLPAGALRVVLCFDEGEVVGTLGESGSRAPS